MTWPIPVEWLNSAGKMRDLIACILYLYVPTAIRKKQQSDRQRGSVMRGVRNLILTEKPDPRFDGNAPPEAVRREFARRLQAALLDKGWNQSELSRRARINRDNVSNYVRGKRLPSAIILDKIVQALGTKVEELLPRAAIQIDPLMPEFDIRKMSGNTVYLRVNRMVTWDQASKIMDLIGPGADKKK